MRSRVVALLIPTCLAAQTLRLRYGGPDSVYHVSNVSSGTPAALTVWRHSDRAQAHNLANGDTVYIQFVPGCAEANGYRRVVNSNPSAGTFGITDLNDNPVTCSSPFDPSLSSGLVGKVGSFTLRSVRPRIFLPGSGDLLARSRDPDGSAPQVAPVVTENDTPWQALLSTYSGYITAGCGEWVITSVPPVELGVDTASVTFTVAGAVPPPQRFIAQCSGGACTILVSVDKPWIVVKPASGNDYVEVSVGVNPLGMRDGVYHGTVTVSAPGALGSPRQISVDMVITEQLRGGGRSSRARLRGRSLMR